MTYKALISDVDGTLKSMRKGTHISKRVIDTVAKAQANGVTICLATARPYEQAHPIWSIVKTNGPSIVSGGAQIVDFANDKILYERPFEKTDLPKIAKILEDEGVIFFINLEPGEGETQYTGTFPQIMLDMYTEALSEKRADEIIDKLSHIPTISTLKVPGFGQEMAKHHVLINHAEATKQHGVFEVCKILGFKKEEVIGIGDGHNDFPLLMACGLKVAIGNAVDDLKAIADYVAPTVEDDGVAHVIEKFILNKKPRV